MKTMAYGYRLLTHSRIYVLAVTAVFLAAIGLLPADAATGLDDNLRGVPPSGREEWDYHGISAEEAKQWIEEGIIFAAWAAQWKGEGFSARSAGKWRKIANVYTAGDFLKNGFGPDEAGEWLGQGIRSGLRAREYLAAGLDAREAGTFWKKGLYPDEAKEWRNAGFDAEAMLQWRYGPRMTEFYFLESDRYSQTVYDVEYAKAWRGEGFAPEDAHLAAAYRFELAEAKQWKDAGFSFREMVLWKDSGFQLEEAVAKRNAGLSAGEADLRRHESSGKEDEITELSADITVRNDGTLEVVETVAIIDRPGGDFREGYYKYAPALQCKVSSAAITFPDPRPRVKSVEVDGRPGDYEVSGHVLKFRRNGAPLTEGEHRITVAYETNSMVLGMPHHDELCFVVLGGVRGGNYVKNASAIVRLPKGADVVFANGNAGLPDRKDLVSELEETGQGDIVRYVVTRPLRQNMAFSIDLGFVKGPVHATWLHKLALIDKQSKRFLSSMGLFACGLAVSFIYYWIAWFTVGRDPKGLGTAISEFSPPRDIDPAGMRAFMGKGKADHLSATAQLLSLADQGLIRIFESEGIYKIEMTRTSLLQLPDQERAFLAELFRDSNRVILTGRPERKQLSRAVHTLKTSVKSEYRQHTERNTRYLWPGIVIAILCIGASLAIIDKSELYDEGKAGLALTAYAAFLATGFGLLTLFFSRLLRRPTKEFVVLLERLHAYAGFLTRNFVDLKTRAYLPPFLQEHLPYAIAAGIDVDGLMIRNSEAKWFKGASGGFGCGDFIQTVKQSL